MGNRKTGLNTDLMFSNWPVLAAIITLWEHQWVMVFDLYECLWNNVWHASGSAIFVLFNNYWKLTDACNIECCWITWGQSSMYINKQELNSPWVQQQRTTANHPQNQNVFQSHQITSSLKIESRSVLWMVCSGVLLLLLDCLVLVCTLQVTG